MQILVPPNAFTTAASQPKVQSPHDCTDFGTRTSTFEYSKSQATFSAEAVSEKAATTPNFSPLARELFGIDEFDFSNHPTCFEDLFFTPEALHINPQDVIPELVPDCSSAITPPNPASSLTPEEQISAKRFPATGGKTTWPGMDQLTNSEADFGDELVTPDFRKRFGRESPLFSKEGEPTTVGSDDDTAGSLATPGQLNWSPSAVKTVGHSASLKRPPSTAQGAEKADYGQSGSDTSDSSSEHDNGEHSNSDTESESALVLPRGGKYFNHHHDQPDTKHSRESIDEDCEADLADDEAGNKQAEQPG